MVRQDRSTAGSTTANALSRIGQVFAAPSQRFDDGDDMQLGGSSDPGVAPSTDQGPFAIAHPRAYGTVALSEGNDPYAEMSHTDHEVEYPDGGVV